MCTGALIVAKAGLAHNIAATTHHAALDELRRVSPDTDVRDGERVVDSGKISFSGGISAGIDAAFDLVAKLLDVATATRTARYMEYDWRGVPDAGSNPAT